MYPQRMAPPCAVSAHTGSHGLAVKPGKVSVSEHARLSYCGLLGLALLLGGCISLSPPAISTSSPIPATSTPTFAFPTLIPTATQTPPPTASPTSDPRIGLGRVVFFDDFDHDLGWQFQIFGSGGAGLLDGAYSLSARQSFTRVIGYSPAEISANGYLEVTVLPILCSNDDEYGLVFRTNPSGEYYRFTLSCAGLARLSRISPAGELVLLADTRPDSVFPGPLVSNTLAVRMEGEILTLFVNGSEIARTRDTVLGSGGLGVFIRTRQGGQATVQFDDFTLWDLAAGSNPLSTSTPQ